MVAVSLSDLVKRPAARSPVRAWFDLNFPGLNHLSPSVRNRLATIPVLVPRGPTLATVVGTAFDLRACLYVAPEAARLGLARRGASRIGSVYDLDARTWSMPDFDPFFDRVEKLLSEVDSTSHRLAPKDERRLCRACVILGRLEQIARSGRQPAGDDRLDDVPNETIDEMVELLNLFVEHFSSELAGPSYMNPTFEGSRLVGGADADMIVTGTLIDLKTTDGQVAPAWWLRQLLGYALLDFSDTYAIDSIGFYFARQGHLSLTDLDRFIDLTTTGSTRSIADWRAEFRTFLEGLNQAKMNDRD